MDHFQFLFKGRLIDYNRRQNCCDKIENSVFVLFRVQKVPFPFSNVDQTSFYCLS